MEKSPKIQDPSQIESSRNNFSTTHAYEMTGWTLRRAKTVGTLVSILTGTQYGKVEG